MSPLALMCAMVLAVQAAAVNTHTVKAHTDTGGKSIHLLGRELKLTNASAMLGELEKMAMSTSGAALPDEDIVNNITQILTDSIIDPMMMEQQELAALGSVWKLPINIEDAFVKCRKEVVYNPLEVKKLKDDVFGGNGFKVLHDECRSNSHEDWVTNNPTTNTDKCQDLDVKLNLVKDAAETLGALPGVDEVGEDGVLKRVQYVKDASVGGVHQEICTSLQPEYSACQSETNTNLAQKLANLEAETAHKADCLGKQVRFEEGICAWRGALHTELEACKTDATCQEKGKGELMEWNKEREEKVAKWKDEFLAVQKIFCFLKTWDANTAAAHKTGFANCTAKTIADYPNEAAKYNVAEGVWKPAPVECDKDPKFADIATANIFPMGKGKSEAFEDEYYTNKNRENNLHDSWTEVPEGDIVTCLDADGKVAKTLSFSSLVQGSLLAQPQPIARDIAAKPIAADKIKREKKLVRREPKQPKPSSLAELDHQGRMLNVKVQAQKHSTSELQDMDMESLLDLVKTSGANTLAIKAAMARSILKMQASSV